MSKRALIVDDSKSARAFLSRILAKYAIEVDTTESAEQAIEYLRGERPDVIFMDHLMPGMDGFQAVQLIKNNPRTAMIPIMMYTSQEGELYVGQARALGAIGVLPKQIQPADVSKVLYQLKLIPDRRTENQRTFTVAGEDAAAEADGPEADMPAGAASSGPDATAPASRGASKPAGSPPTALPAAASVTASAAAVPAAARAAAAGGSIPAPGGPASSASSSIAGATMAASELRAIVDSAVERHVGSLRRELAVHLDDQHTRLLGDVRSMLQELPPAPAAAPAAPPPELPAARPAPWGWIAAALLLAVAIGLAALWWREAQSVRSLSARLSEARADADTLAERLAADQAAAARRAALLATAADSAAGGPAVIAREPVPYGEVPLAGDRLPAVRAALADAVERRASDTLEIRTIPGRFCLVGNAGDGYSLATDETPFRECDLVGNPAYDALPPAQRESLAFANLLAESRRDADGVFDVRVAYGDPDELLAAYPPVVDGLTAGEWNLAGATNNRVEIRTLAAR